MAQFTVTLDDENPPLLDLGHNDISTQVSGTLTVGKVPLPDGTVTGFLTLRIPNVTVMMPLDRAGIAAWKARLDELDRILAASVSGLIMPGTPSVLPGAVRPGR